MSSFFPGRSNNSKNSSGNSVNKPTASKVVRSKDIEKGSYLFTDLDTKLDPEIQKVKSPSVILSPEDIKSRESTGSNHTEQTSSLKPRPSNNNTPLKENGTPQTSLSPNTPSQLSNPASSPSPVNQRTNSFSKLTTNSSDIQVNNSESISLSVSVDPSNTHNKTNSGYEEYNLNENTPSGDSLDNTKDSAFNTPVKLISVENKDSNSTGPGKKRIRATRPGQNKSVKSDEPLTNEETTIPKNESSLYKELENSTLDNNSSYQHQTPPNQKEENSKSTLYQSQPQTQPQTQSSQLQTQSQPHQSQLLTQSQPQSPAHNNNSYFEHKLVDNRDTTLINSNSITKTVSRKSDASERLKNYSKTTIDSSPAHSPHNNQSLEVRLKKIEENLSQWQTKLDTLVSSQDKLLVTKRDYYLKLIQISKLQKKLEKRQKEILDSENFDEAESIAEQIENLKTETKQLLNQTISTTRDWINLEGDRGRLFSTLSQVRSTALTHLQQLETEQTTKIGDIKRKIYEENQSMDYSYGKSIQRIERELVHTKSDIESLDEKAQKIEQIIQERTASQRNERVSLIAKKNTLMDNRSKILSRIEALEQEERNCDSKLESLDKDITALRDKYKPDTEKIFNDKSRLEKAHAALISEQEEVNKETEYYNAKIRQFRNDSQKHDSLLGVIENSISNFRNTIKLYNQITIESHEIRLKEENNIEDQCQEELDINRIRQSSSDLSNRVKELSSLINGIRNEIRSVEQLINNKTNNIIPNLENDKKIVVKGKDYRKAKEIQQQISDVQQEAEELNKRKTQLEDSLSRSLLQLDSTQNEYDQKEFELKQKLKSRDQLRLEKLLIRIKNLQNQLRSAQANPLTPSHQIRTIETKLLIEQSQVNYICLSYDIASPLSYPLEEQEIPQLGQDESDDQPVDYELTDEAPLDHIHTEPVYQKSSTVELFEEKKQELSRMDKLLLQLETELSNAVEVEDFNLAETIQIRITEVNQRKSELSFWISKNQNHNL